MTTETAWKTRVFELRVRLNLSQQALADRIGVARGTVTAWETGHQQPDKLRAARLGMLEAMALR